MTQINDSIHNPDDYLSGLLILESTKFELLYDCNAHANDNGSSEAAVINFEQNLANFNCSTFYSFPKSEDTVVTFRDLNQSATIHFATSALFPTMVPPRDKTSFFSDIRKAKGESESFVFHSRRLSLQICISGNYQISEKIVQHHRGYSYLSKSIPEFDSRFQLLEISLKIHEEQWRLEFTKPFKRMLNCRNSSIRFRLCRKSVDI